VRQIEIEDVIKNISMLENTKMRNLEKHQYYTNIVISNNKDEIVQSKNNA